MTLLARITLWLGGLGFLGFGLAFLIDPVATLGAAGFGVTGDGAAAELRAFYGGVEIALGILLIACDLRPGRRRDGLLLSLASYGSIGAARALYYPQLSLTGSFGSVSAALTNFLTGPSIAWSAIAGLDGPVFNAGAIAGQVQSAEATSTGALASY